MQQFYQLIFISRYFPEEDIEKGDRQQLTAFHLAARNRTASSLRLLCDVLDEIPMRGDKLGNTPLHYAVKYGK
jgi:ankyrin repeat protein